MFFVSEIKIHRAYLKRTQKTSFLPEKKDDELQKLFIFLLYNTQIICILGQIKVRTAILGKKINVARRKLGELRYI